MQLMLLKAAIGHREHWMYMHMFYNGLIFIWIFHFWKRAPNGRDAVCTKLLKDAWSLSKTPRSGDLTSYPKEAM